MKINIALSPSAKREGWPSRSTDDTSGQDTQASKSFQGPPDQARVGKTRKQAAWQAPAGKESKDNHRPEDDVSRTGGSTRLRPKTAQISKEKWA